jgi:hypothetical protein
VGHDRGRQPAHRLPEDQQERPRARPHEQHEATGPEPGDGREERHHERAEHRVRRDPARVPGGHEQGHLNDDRVAQRDEARRHAASEQGRAKRGQHRERRHRRPDGPWVALQRVERRPHRAEHHADGAHHRDEPPRAPLVGVEVEVRVVRVYATNPANPGPFGGLGGIASRNVGRRRHGTSSVRGPGIVEPERSTRRTASGRASTGPRWERRPRRSSGCWTRSSARARPLRARGCQARRGRRRAGPRGRS